MDAVTPKHHVTQLSGYILQLLIKIICETYQYTYTFSAGMQIFPITSYFVILSTTLKMSLFLRNIKFVYSSQRTTMGGLCRFSLFPWLK